MSEQIDEIIVKYVDLFKGREKEIKAYLTKNYLRLFETREIIDVQTVDSSDRIKKSGFQKQLSSWRNYYENINISSCLVVDNEKKRFDHKFLFTQEKLNDLDKRIESLENK